VIAKAKEACKNSGQPVENHLVEFNEMVSIGSGAELKAKEEKDE
jgi:DNA-damage-inducible protein D